MICQEAEGRELRFYWWVETPPSINVGATVFRVWSFKASWLCLPALCPASLGWSQRFLSRTLLLQINIFSTMSPTGSAGSAAPGGASAPPPQQNQLRPDPCPPLPVVETWLSKGWTPNGFIKPRSPEEPQPGASLDGGAGRVEQQQQTTRSSSCSETMTEAHLLPQERKGGEEALLNLLFWCRTITWC